MPAPGLDAAKLREVVAGRAEVREGTPCRGRRLALIGGGVLWSICLAVAWANLGYLDVVRRKDSLGQEAILVVRVCDRSPRALVVVVPAEGRLWGANGIASPRLSLPRLSTLELLRSASPPATLWLPERQTSLSIDLGHEELVLTDFHDVLFRLPGPFPAELGPLIDTASWTAPLPQLLDGLYPEGQALTPYCEGRTSTRIFRIVARDYRLTWVANRGRVGGLLITPQGYSPHPKALMNPGQPPSFRLRLGTCEVGPGEAAYYLGAGTVIRTRVELQFEHLLAATRRIERGALVRDELEELVPGLFR